MNTFKRRASIAAIFGLAIVALTMAGCATPPQQAAGPPTDARTSVAAMVAGCADAIKDIVSAPGGDAASKVAGVGAVERMCGSGGQQLFAFAQQQQVPPSSIGAVLWQSALQVADIALRGYGIKANRDVAVVQSNNMASTTIASYNAFSSMGNSIAAAGTAGYQYVQAPGAVTTNTLSGAGVIGSGTYTGPVSTTTTTTRTCTGAAGGNGAGTTTGAPGGAGGPASC